MSDTSYLKMHFNGSAIVLKADVVAQPFHQENPPAPQGQNIFRSGWIRQFAMIEPAALVGDAHCDLIILLFQVHLNHFRFIPVVAVDDGVVNGFGDTDQNIAVYVWTDAVAFCHARNPRVDRAEAPWSGRQFENDSL